MSSISTNLRNLTQMTAVLCIVAGSISATNVAIGGTPLQIALNRTTQGTVYRYDVDYETDEIVSHLSVDPTKPSGQRVVVSTPPESDWTEDFIFELSSMDAEADSRIWCRDFAENIPLNSVPLSQTDTTITYEFVPVATDEDDAKIMPNLIGLVTVTKIDPAIVDFRMYAPQSFKPMWLARIDQFDMHAQCERVPDGRTYITSLNFEISGKFGFKPLSERSSWRISAMQPTD